MGRDKATLPWHGHTLLEEVLRRMSRVIPSTNIIVVAAPHQTLPSLPQAIRVLRDPLPGEGPLRGMNTGLACVDAPDQWVYVSSCDTPLLEPGWINALFTIGEEPWDCVIPRDATRCYPLAALYRPRIVPVIQDLLRRGERRPRKLAELVRTLWWSVERLRAVDPHLLTLCNMNTPEDYARYLAEGIAGGHAYNQGDERG